jgi:hypothetical protein
MIAGYEWSVGQSRLVEPAEIIFNSGDMRIASRGVFTTPLSFHHRFTESPYAWVQLAVDKHHRFFLYFRYDRPSDRYYGPHEVVLNRREAMLFSTFQLTHFSWYADGTGRLDVRCVPGIVGGVFYDLAGISAADGQTLTGLIKQQQEPQSAWSSWF